MNCWHNGLQYAPGSYVCKDCDKCICRENGEWDVVEENAPICTPNPSGEILLDQMEFWDSVAEEWIPYPPSLPLGADIGFRVPIRNTSTVKQHMRLRAYVIRPDGKGGDAHIHTTVDAGQTKICDFRRDAYPPVYNFPQGNKVGDWAVSELKLDADIYGG